MFRTADGEMLELAPWRMRRLMRLIATARHYPDGTPPHTLIQDLRQIIGRARRVSTQPRIGTKRYQSVGACCQACLLARQHGDVLSLVGLSIGLSSGLGLPSLEFESMPKSANVTLNWQCLPSLTTSTTATAVPGVYMLFRGRLPLYVGISANMAERLHDHLASARRLRSTNLRVCFAPVRLAYLPAVEHALVRALGPRVSNDKLQRPLTVGAGGLTIIGLLPPGVSSPKAPGNVIRLMPGSEFEWAS
jgi:hypothetical protein